MVTLPNLRTAPNNPFTPGSDIVPDIWAGRTSEIADWTMVVRPCRTLGLPERGRAYLGEAGVGKSALARRICDLATASGDWVTPQIRIPAGSDPLKALANALLRLAKQTGVIRLKRLKQLITRVTAISVKGFAVTLEPAGAPEPYLSLFELFVELGKAAQKEGRAVVIHVDEVQNITNAEMLSQLLIALGDAITYQDEIPQHNDRPAAKKALPLCVYLTGLPEFLNLVGAEHGATFSRRFKTEILANIDDNDFSLALMPFVDSGWNVGMGKVYLTQDAMSELVNVCKGDPFLFQLAGEKAWFAGTSSSVTPDDVRRGWLSASTEATGHVSRIINRLPEKERLLIESMAKLSPAERTATNVAKAMGFSDSTYIGSTAKSLDDGRKIINRGKPYTFQNKAIEAFLTSDWP